MELDEIRLLERHPAWRLLRARNAPLVLGFLGAVFVEGNDGALGQAQLADRLDDYLFAANDGRPADQRWTGDPTAYLDDWSAAETGWLRRFYPDGVDEVHYDATPALERAYAWVTSLRARASVGTESRLHLLFELLRQMAHGADADPQSRLEELQRRRAAIDEEIAAVGAGTF
ncbi:MAG: uncharacterized protein JWL64_279, partial [Frankiales bacterium]|nr:uncharacterized protein [Frankiales bacterium]